MARKDLRLYLSDPGPVLILAILPLVLMEFLQPGYRLALTAEGFDGANGSEQAVPGMAVLYAFLFVANVGMSFFREFGWGTWARLRGSQLRPHELVLGKVLVPFCVALGLQVVLFALGALLFRIDVSGNIAALLPIAATLSVCVVALGVALMAWSRTMMQFGVLANLMSLVLASLGGAITPSSLLPDWAQTIAPISPCYWAMQGFRDVILRDGGMADVLRPTLVLLSFGVVLAGAATVAITHADAERELL